MTIEIRELIIEARVSEPTSKTSVGRAINDPDNDALIQEIVQQVVSQLRDEIRGLT